MSLGKSDGHDDIFSPTRFCDGRLSETSVFRLLHREGHRLFPDEAFADIFSSRGRRSVPPRVVATVMVLQRLEGLSDREAVDRFAYDLRWKYAAGGLSVDDDAFVHTVLVDMRERLRRSGRPNRVFEAVLEVGKAAGLVGRRRVVDSTALYDAVATQDTVTMIRAAIRGVLRVADESLGAELRVVLKREDDYGTPGKPVCDWTDEAAREALVDALARDGHAVLAVLDDRELSSEMKAAGELLATVLGQDLEQREDGLFRIARRVASDRVISTVDPQARHGHKTAARGFDGYKGHVVVDPDTEIITATEVTPGNVADGDVAMKLLDDVLAPTQEGTVSETPAGAAPEHTPQQSAAPAERVEVYGDASYGTAALVEQVTSAGAESYLKTPPPSASGGLLSKASFKIDLDAGTATCPSGVNVSLSPQADGSALAKFGHHCESCPLRSQCTKSPRGRQLRVHAKERVLHEARQRTAQPERQQKYKATRPKVERKIAHLMRRRHGGRRARVRGTLRVAHDFSLLAAAVNLSRLAALRIRHRDGQWGC